MDLKQKLTTRYFERLMDETEPQASTIKGIKEHIIDHGTAAQIEAAMSRLLDVPSAVDWVNKNMDRALAAIEAGTEDATILPIGEASAV